MKKHTDGLSGAGTRMADIARRLTSATQPAESLDALVMVLLQRRKQLEKWDAAHDDGHKHGELSIASALCILGDLRHDPTNSTRRGGDGPPIRMELDMRYSYEGFGDFLSDTWMAAVAGKYQTARMEQLAVGVALGLAELEREIRDYRAQLSNA